MAVTAQLEHPSLLPALHTTPIRRVFDVVAACVMAALGDGGKLDLVCGRLPAVARRSIETMHR